MPAKTNRVPSPHARRRRDRHESGKLRPNFEVMETRRLPATINVTTLLDQVGVDGYVSLREAIQSINGQADVNADVAAAGTYGVDDAITFTGLSGTISLNSDLDALVRAVHINGTTGSNYTGRPVITVDGTSTYQTFKVTGPDVILDALAIVGSSSAGVAITGVSATGVSIIRCHIGIDAAGVTRQPNVEGVEISGGASYNTIGGTTPGTGNVISGNAQVGVMIDGDIGHETVGNIVRRNLIGTDASGTADVGNGAGVLLTDNVSNNVIGGVEPEAGNIISANLSGGIGLHARDPNGPVPTGNMIQGNIVGLDRAGGARLGFQPLGVYIGEGSRNTVGGTAPGAGNIISGNLYQGVNFSGPQTTNNVLQGNIIGLNAAGDAAPNYVFGLLINRGSSGNLIGGTTPAARNVISSNSMGEVFVQGWLMSPGPQVTSDNRIQGNYIGTNLSGTAAASFNGFGLRISDNSQRNTVGGTTPGAGNVIVGKSENLVLSGPGTSDNVISGNMIGTNAAGTAGIGQDNRGVVITVGPTNNTIGGTLPGAGNLISGNGREGLVLEGEDTTGNRILGNKIGVDLYGNPLGNAGNGVSAIVGALRNFIGGVEAGAGNVIAYNAGAGVSVGLISAPWENVRDISIRGNAIFANGKLGIDLGGDGVTPNSPGGPHVGPNLLQNYPVLNRFIPGSTTRLFGTLNSTPGTTFMIDVYANPAGLVDPSGYGQGARYLGSFPVTTDAQGNAVFQNVPLGASTAGEFLTATATDPDGNTSEFSYRAGSLSGLIVVGGDGQGAEVTKNFGSLLQVKAVDSQGRPVAGVIVTFTLPSGGASGTFAGLGTTATAVTDVNGVATAPTLTANQVAGRFAVTASADTGGTVVFSLVNTPAAPARLAVAGGDGQAAPVNTAFAVPFQVLVYDAFGNPVPGATVTFAAPAGGPGGTFEGGTATVSVSTDGGGRATAPIFTANAVPGTFSVVASLNGVGEVSFLATNQVAVPPTVVNLARFGYHALPTSLVLTFSTAMDAARASDLGNYRLVTPGRDRRFGTRDDVVVRLASAAYDPATYSVRLAPAARRLPLFQRYQLTVNGQPTRGLTDRAGTYLAGNGSGQPGTDYVRRFGPEVLVRNRAVPAPRRPVKVVVPARHAAPGTRQG